MNKIWLTSDLHFCHNKDFLYSPRGFESVYDMNEAIVKNFNEVIDWADKLYILGDCFLNNNEEGIKYLKRLPGEKHIIYGNHDTETRRNILDTLAISHYYDIHTHGDATTLDYNGYHFFLCHYPTMTANFDVDKPLKRRLLSLSGHTHSKEIWDAAGGYNVALDAHNCYPVEINEIIQAFQSKT